MKSLTYFCSMKDTFWPFSYRNNQPWVGFSLVVITSCLCAKIYEGGEGNIKRFDKNDYDQKNHKNTKKHSTTAKLIHLFRIQGTLSLIYWFIVFLTAPPPPFLLCALAEERGRRLCSLNRPCTQGKLFVGVLWIRQALNFIKPQFVKWG